jgi:hypothetical protein
MYMFYYFYIIAAIDLWSKEPKIRHILVFSRPEKRKEFAASGKNNNVKISKHKKVVGSPPIQDNLF